jgi:REP element-mobilizing transposase RayT
MQLAEIEPAAQPALAYRPRPPRPRADASVEVRYIVFFLNDALGEDLLVRMERTPEKVTLAEALAALCRFEGSGALAYPWNAKSVEDALRARDGKDYRLLGVRMLPNHVHVLLEAAPTWPSGDPIHRWKTASSPRRKATLRPGLERCGPDRLRPRALRLEQPRPDEFWADEDFEVVLHTAQELEDVRRRMDRISPPSRTPARAEPEDEADISPPSPPPPAPPTEPQPTVVQKWRAGARSAKDGRLSRFLQEVRECASDLAVLYAWYFSAVGMIALLQHVLGQLAQHR